MAEKHLNNCSIFLLIREMQIKITLMFILHLSEWPQSTTQVTLMLGKCGHRKHSSVTAVSSNVLSHCGN